MSEGVQWVECEQGTPEWYRARMGIPTASEFKTLLGIKKDARDKKTRDTYLKKLAGEILSGMPMESYQNEYMQRGKEMEAEARDKYAFLFGVEPQIVGFGRNGRKGCSPDSLIGDAGMIEIKTKAPHLLIDCWDRDECPSEHYAQCQGALWVAEREWIDFVAYWPNMPLFVKRVTWDPDYIAALRQAVDDANAEIDEIVARMRSRGAAPAQVAA
jgi:hypothetical protein